MRQYCLCRHPKESHDSAVVNNKVVPFCRECEQCNGFGVIEPPRPSHAQLVDAADWARETEQPPAKSKLLYAWNTRWCPECGSRYFPEDASCCGAPCLPVRLEMHSREPL